MKGDEGHGGVLHGLKACVGHTQDSPLRHHRTVM
jgi:hypothetical protein